VNDFSPVDHYKRHCKCLHTVGGRCLIFRRTLLRYMRIMAPVVCLSFVVCRLSSVQRSVAAPQWRLQRSAREAAAPSQITGPPLDYPTTALSGSLEQSKLWNFCMYLLGFEFAQALMTVIEELVTDESGIVTDMSKAQTTGKLSRRRT